MEQRFSIAANRWLKCQVDHPEFEDGIELNEGVRNPHVHSADHGYRGTHRVQEPIPHELRPAA